MSRSLGIHGHAVPGTMVPAGGGGRIAAGCHSENMPRSPGASPWVHAPSVSAVCSAFVPAHVGILFRNNGFMLSAKFLIFVLHVPAIEMVAEHISRCVGCKGMTISSTETLGVQPDGNLAMRLALLPGIGMLL